MKVKGDGLHEPEVWEKLKFFPISTQTARTANHGFVGRERVGDPLHGQTLVYTIEQVKW